MSCSFKLLDPLRNGPSGSVIIENLHEYKLYRKQVGLLLRVPHLRGLENLAVLQVFGVEGRAPGLWGKGRDERVINFGFGIS